MMANKPPYSHNAFSMITTIFVILIMATVSAFILNLSGKIVQGTTTQYRKEQAILYAKSYTELAIMAATAKTCVQKISGDIGGNQAEVKAGQGYRVVVDIQYVGNNSACSNKLTNGSVDHNTSKDNIILIDTYVHYRDPNHPSALSGHPWSTHPGITYHRRTIQRL